MNHALGLLPILVHQDPKRTFIWSEISFLHRWWEESPKHREAFKKLVAARQIEIVGGGWVQNDEANTYLLDIIDQYTEGHQWLRRVIGTDAQPQFGYVCWCANCCLYCSSD
jgi:alpha-mannosidase II